MQQLSGSTDSKFALLLSQLIAKFGQLDSGIEAAHAAAAAASNTATTDHLLIGLENLQGK